MVFSHLNSRSICNKSSLIKNFIADHDIDLCALTETWLRGDDSDLYNIRDICPAGYVFYHAPRLHSTGGGVGVVLTNNFKVVSQVRETYRRTATNCFARLVVLYRPPLSSVSLFFDELADNLGHMTTVSGYFLMFGDFNLHVDSCDTNGRRFENLLQSFNLAQHIQGSRWNFRLSMGVARVQASVASQN